MVPRGSGAVALALILTMPVGAAEQARQGGRRTSSVIACASELGVGTKTKRRFCDVIIASTPRASISMAIPAHTGPATLMFDLHNRFPVPPQGADPIQAFARHTAVVAIVRPTGEVIERAAISREYRNPSDLFDRIGGRGRGAAPLSVAPGGAEPIQVTIPAGVTSIGIVGTRLEEWRATGRGASDAPDRPIALVSNVRVTYTPR